MKIGVSGHQNIPPQAIEYIRRGIADIIFSANDSLIGISSLAVGADQLFASLVLEHGGQLHVIIPCRNYETTFPDKTELEQYKFLLNKADNIEILDCPRPSEDAYLEAGRRIADSSDLLIAVWDGKPAQGKGGTADIAYYAMNRGIKVEVVWPDGVTR
jgi:hypothetical protein